MKNIILIKNRMFDFYDFNKLKENYSLQISIVTFKHTAEHLSEEIIKSVDRIYSLENISSTYDSPLPLEGLTKIVEESIKLENNTYIIAADELNVLSAAKLREKFNLPGSKPFTLANYRNKVRQKEILQNAGIKTPKFVHVNTHASGYDSAAIYFRICQELGSPFIIKPIDMGGSTAVEKIENYHQFSSYLKKHPEFMDFIAEQLIEGRFYHCDFIIQNQAYLFIEVSKYIHNGLSFMKGYNHGSLLLTRDDPLQAPIIEFCKKANTILGLDTGCGHFEVFVTPQQEIVFIEAAARPAGSMVPLVLSKTFKNNFLNAALIAEVQEDPGCFLSPMEYYFWVVFPKFAGIVEKLSIPSLQSSFEIKWLVERGSILERSNSVSDKSGSLLAKNDNRKALEADFNYFRNFKAIETMDISTN